MQQVINTWRELPDAEILVILPNGKTLKEAREQLSGAFPDVERFGGQIFDNYKGVGGMIYLKILGDALAGLRFDFVFVHENCRKCGNSESRILNTEAYLAMLFTKIKANGYGGVIELCEWQQSVQ